jgi:hypothetical protein
VSEYVHRQFDDKDRCSIGVFPNPDGSVRIAAAGPHVGPWDVMVDIPASEAPALCRAIMEAGGHEWPGEVVGKVTTDGAQITETIRRRFGHDMRTDAGRAFFDTIIREIEADLRGVTPAALPGNDRETV